jgi:ribonucleotide monophosphatase NagD (HAD superfamily)
MQLIYGIPQWLMKKYMVDLGAVEQEADVMVGDGWRASVKQGEPARIGSLVVGRIQVDLEGEPQVLDDLLEKLHWKTMRGGG